MSLTIPRSLAASCRNDPERMEWLEARAVPSTLQFFDAEGAGTPFAAALYAPPPTVGPELLDARAALFAYETQYHRALADFAQRLAELESLVGREVLP